MFKDARFCFLLFGTSIALFPLFVPPFFLPLFATSVGLSAKVSSYLLAGLSVPMFGKLFSSLLTFPVFSLGYNISSAGGRIAFGLFADSLLGSLNSLLLCLVMVTVSTLAIWPFATTIAPLVVFAIINGFCGMSFLLRIDLSTRADCGRNSTCSWWIVLSNARSRYFPIRSKSFERHLLHA